jgi:hypothetical protein
MAHDEQHHSGGGEGEDEEAEGENGHGGERERHTDGEPDCEPAYGVERFTAYARRPHALNVRVADGDPPPCQ